jgi:hypothetical protein
MPDIADKAEEASETMLQHALHMARNNGPLAPQSTDGRCLFCGEPVKVVGARWCWVECRDEYQKRCQHE